MGGEIQIAVLLAAFTVSCGGDPGPRKVEQPTLETLEPAAPGSGARLGRSAAPGFFRACQTVATGGGLVELRCDVYQVVEFRKPDSGGSGDADLDDLLKVLGARFGELEETRRDARIDELAIRLSDFQSVDEAGPRGMAASVSNSQGQYWAFACYRKGGEVSEDFCGDAIATAARAGGLAYVQAKALEDFGGGALEVPASCEATPGTRIVCPTGQLSLQLKRKESSCRLLGKKALCLHLELTNPSEQEALHFVLVTGGGQERLVVCSYPDSPGSSLPEPCGQAIELK
jgi:hypothetical protein